MFIDYTEAWQVGERKSKRYNQLCWSVIARPNFAVTLLESGFNVLADVANQISPVNQADTPCAAFAAKGERTDGRFESVVLARQDQNVEKTARQSRDWTLLARLR